MENKRFLTAQDVMEMLGVSLSWETGDGSLPPSVSEMDKGGVKEI